MKFGDTLYQRSIPQWAAYNVNYNEIKQLIKERTSSGVAAPVSIPNGSSHNRWDSLEDELVSILKDQHDNVILFLNSKYGEIDRRLSYLEKQTKSARKSARLPGVDPTRKGRKYRKLLQDAEIIGQDIQNLTRFAGVQKTAFRKLLKKYRKWTGSMTLRIRLENEVLAAGQLNLDYERPLERLANLTDIIRGLQSAPLDTGPESARSSFSQHASNIDKINAADEKGPLELDAALAITPYGESAGSAIYWIHPDNLDEAQALLLRHVREIQCPLAVSRKSSQTSISPKFSKGQLVLSDTDYVHVAYFDNTQRFLQDTSSHRPSRIALSMTWRDSSEAVVTLSDLAVRNSSATVINVKRKEIPKIFKRQAAGRRRLHSVSGEPESVEQVLEYLAEHRDVKPLAEARVHRSRFAGLENTVDVGVWATLDNDVTFSSSTSSNGSAGQVDNDGSETRTPFPHAILTIRWECARTPESVRAFDKSHLVEKVRGFTLESAAIHLANEDLQAPSWKHLLNKDIRKVPAASKVAPVERSSMKIRMPEGTSSGTSSTDGPDESVFSAPDMPSSATSIISPGASTRELPSPIASKLSARDLAPKKKKLRIVAESPPPRASRYWNEFDDGDEDVNPHETYMISVNPDQSLFPGTEAISKAFTKMYNSLDNSKSRLLSFFYPELRSMSNEKRRTKASAHLLGDSGSRSNSDEIDSSDSDSTQERGRQPSFGTFDRSQYRPRQVLTPRQEALERTYLIFYTGLITLSYVLLGICAVLLSAGRKKDYVEIDVAVAAGIAVAEICAFSSLVLMWMRRMPLSVLHKGLIIVAVTGIVLVGAGEVVGLVHRPIKK